MNYLDITTSKNLPIMFSDTRLCSRLILVSYIVLLVCALGLVINFIIKLLLYIRKVSIFWEFFKKYPFQKIEKNEIFENNCLYENLIKLSDNSERIDNYIYIIDIVNELLNLFILFVVPILSSLYAYVVAFMVVVYGIIRINIALHPSIISIISLAFSILIFMYMCKKIKEDQQFKTENYMKIRTFLNNLSSFIIIKKLYTDFQHYISNNLKVSNCEFNFCLF